MRRWWIAFVVLGLAAACGEGLPDRAGDPPEHDAAIVIPELAEGPVAAGDVIELVYPGGQLRGSAHLLQRWDGEAWLLAYKVAASDPDDPAREERGEWSWAPPGEEFVTEAIGYEGPGGGQFMIVPPPAQTGTYRVCSERPGQAGSVDAERTTTTLRCSEAFDVVG